MILIVAPWSAYWDRSLALWYPDGASWLGNSFVRGAVSGIGLITAIAGFVELASVFGLRNQADVADPAPRD